MHRGEQLTEEEINIKYGNSEKSKKHVVQYMARLLLGESEDLTTSLLTVVVLSRSKNRRILLAGGESTDPNFVKVFLTEIKKGQRRTLSMSKKESELLKKSLSDELFSVKNNCEYVHQERRKMNIQMNEDDGLDMVRFLFLLLFRRFILNKIFCIFLI